MNCDLVNSVPFTFSVPLSQSSIMTYSCVCVRLIILCDKGLERFNSTTGPEVHVSSSNGDLGGLVVP